LTAAPQGPVGGTVPAYVEPAGYSGKYARTARLISAATRLQGIFFWDFLMYLTEGFLFLITGLQARALITGNRDDSVSNLIISAAIICAVVIAAASSGCFRRHTFRVG
jgi:NhaP-type Na+/H+ or K+/H+ antiporter